MSGSSFTSGTQTQASCIASCKANGFAFAGLEAGNDCRCSKTLDAANPNYYVAYSDCSYKCTGEDKNCGGWWRQDVFSTAQYVAPANTSVPAAGEGSLGCTGLGSFVSAAKVSVVSATGMTVGYCRRMCRMSGYDAAALGKGNCGYTIQALLGYKGRTDLF
jgi:hypothetical protein